MVNFILHIILLALEFPVRKFSFSGTVCIKGKTTRNSQLSTSFKMFETARQSRMAETSSDILQLKTEEQKPTSCHLLFYCTSYRLNMFRALLCPSSGTGDYIVDYHIGLFVLGVLYVGS